MDAELFVSIVLSLALFAILAMIGWVLILRAERDILLEQVRLNGEAATRWRRTATGYARQLIELKNADRDPGPEHPDD